MKIIHQAMIAIVFILICAAASAGEKGYTIEDAYKAALGTNETVKMAEEDILQSEFRVDQAWTHLYPRLDARGAYTRFNDTLPPGGGAFIFQPTDQYSAGLVLTQPLYTGGRTYAALRTTQKMLEVSKKGLTVSEQNIMIGVTEAFYGVLKAQKSIEISGRSLERMEHHKKVTEREAATRKSKANVSALLRANTLVSQARISLVRAEDGLKVAREKLSLLTRIPVDAELAEPKPSETPTDGIDKLMETAFTNREDYKSSQVNQNIAAENITIVRGGHYPQVYAEAGLTYLHSVPETGMDATSYYGGLRIQIPIFEGGLMKSEVAEARSKLRKSEFETLSMKRNIESEVHEAHINLRTIASVLDTARVQLGYARENFDAVEGLFAEGLAPSLSLIDAEQALSFAEREIMNATYDQQLAILRLRKSVGTLGKEDR